MKEWEKKSLLPNSAIWRLNTLNLNDSNLSRSQIEQIIYEWIFNKKHRDILIDRLLDGMTYQDIAEKYDISIQQTKNIIYKSQDRLFRHLKWTIDIL